MEEKTICAISTPIGSGGISIIRLSGKDALAIASKVFHCNIAVKDFEPRKMYLGEFDAENFKDKCFMVYFKSPNSYTGEDLVEFQCHGGVKLANGILSQLLLVGAEMADAGEFTKRAFLNGKVSLDEAEGVIDLINSETESQINAGYELMQGNLRKVIEKTQNKLTTTMAKLEVAMDYPEEELETGTAIETKTELNEILNDLKELAKTSVSGKLIKNGCKLVILGKTNVGKSSLMNALLEYERAIVTDVQGTTRDLLEDSFEYKGVKFILVDTAGIRDSKNKVELIGIEKAKNVVRSADIVLYVVDSSKPLDSEDKEMMGSLAGKKVVAIINKCDLKQRVEEQKLITRFGNVIKISAKNNSGILEIKERVYNMCIGENSMQNSVMLTNTRHIHIINDAIKLTQTALTTLSNELPLDLLSIDIKNVWLKLGEITGETNIETVVNEIFSKFCLGK